MKIVLISAVPPPEGGIATWTKKFINYSKINGHEVIVVNTALSGIRGKRINSRRSLLDEVIRTHNILHNARDAFKEYGVDLVHVNSSCSTFGIIRDYLIVTIAYKRKLPIIFHCHCNVKDQLHPKYGAKILQKICHKVNMVFTLNSASYNYVRQLCENRVKVIPNFIDENTISDSHSIRDKIQEVVFVGHVQKTKGCSEIIEVARLMPEIHFTLVGPIHDDYEKLRIPRNLSLVGPKHMDEVTKYLTNADVYLFPSYTEGFSLSLTEAMANGLPCIVTSVGANKDMIEDFGGVIVPIKDVKSIISGFCKMNSKEIRNQMSIWNIEKVKKNYLTPCVLNEVFELYFECLGGRCEK